MAVVYCLILNPSQGSPLYSLPLCSLPFYSLLSLWQARHHSLPSYTRVRYLSFEIHPSFVVMGETWFQREFLTPRRLVFNILFYGSQIFWFALGWYLQVRLNIISLRRVLLTASLLSGNKPQTCRSEWPQVLGLDISWRRSCPCLHRWSHPPPDAPQHHSYHSSQTHVVIPCR